MRPKLFEDDEDDSLQNEDISKFEIDEDYGRRLEYNRKREDLQRYEELKKKGLINDDEPDEDSDVESEPDDYDIVENPKKEIKFFDSLLKIKRRDPSITDKDVKFFESDEEDNKKDQKEKKKKKKKKLYLKDVQAKHLLEEGPEYDEEDSDGGKERKVKTYAEQQEELRKALCDAMEAGGTESDEDAGDLLRVTEKKGYDFEEDEELVKKADEYFEDAEVDESQKFLKDYFLKQLWKEKDEKSKMAVIDEAQLDELEQDEEFLDLQEEFETKFRHEENAGETVMGQSRKVEGSVRKKDNARKTQRKRKEERMKIAETERLEELKQLKNVKKKEIKEKMKKVLSIAGFKEGDECALDAKDLDDEFDPEEYDKMMKAVFDDKYYGAEDLELISDDDSEKPDFDKEDELLGLPKDWDVIQGRDGFTAAREKALKHNDDIVADDGEAEEEEEEEEAEEEEGVEGKRKRKRKTTLVQRAKEALMEEYYKLDYEDTIGDLKTRFKYAKVQPNKFELETEEILGLDDTELNQYVPLKKIAPYVEKDWEVNKHKVKEQKLRNKELLQKKGNNKQKDEKRKKKRKKEEIIVEKRDEEVEGESSKLSRKAKRRRRQAEKKLPPNRMAAYGKA